MVMSQEEDLVVSSVFGALTRPAMTAGVTIEYHGLNLVLSVCAFIAMNNLLYGAIFLPIHLFGWMVCKAEPRFFQILFVKLKMPSHPNEFIWKVRAYEPY